MEKPEGSPANPKKGFNCMNKTNKLITLIPTKHPKVYDVKLNLEFETRYIGKIDTAGDGTFISVRNEAHLFRKTNSLGLNYDLLSSEDVHFKNILIIYNGKKLLTTREYFLKKGKIFQFAKKGFELQMFLSLDEFNLKKALEFHRSFGGQIDLFNSVA